MSRKKTREEVIAEFIACHGDGRYNYDLVEYKDGKTKVQIICKTVITNLLKHQLNTAGQNCPNALRKPETPQKKFWTYNRLMDQSCCSTVW